MKKSFVVALHICFWTCYIILIAIVLGVYYQNNPSGGPEFRAINAVKSILLFAFIPSFISFYLFYYVLFPKYLQQEKFFLASMHDLFALPVFCYEMSLAVWLIVKGINLTELNGLVLQKIGLIAPTFQFQTNFYIAKFNTLCQFIYRMSMVVLSQSYWLKISK